MVITIGILVIFLILMFSTISSLTSDKKQLEKDLSDSHRTLDGFYSGLLVIVHKLEQKGTWKYIYDEPGTGDIYYSSDKLRIRFNQFGRENRTPTLYFANKRQTSSIVFIFRILLRELEKENQK